MEVKIMQWSSNQTDNTTDVVVSVLTYVNEYIKERKEYEFTITGIYENIDEVFKEKVYNIVSKLK